MKKVARLKEGLFGHFPPQGFQDRRTRQFSFFMPGLDCPGIKEGLIPYFLAGHTDKLKLSLAQVEANQKIGRVRQKCRYLFRGRHGYAPFFLFPKKIAVQTLPPLLSGNKPKGLLLTFRGAMFLFT